MERKTVTQKENARGQRQDSKATENDCRKQKWILIKYVLRLQSKETWPRAQWISEMLWTSGNHEPLSHTAFVVLF